MQGNNLRNTRQGGNTTRSQAYAAAENRVKQKQLENEQKLRDSMLEQEVQSRIAAENKIAQLNAKAQKAKTAAERRILTNRIKRETEFIQRVGDIQERERQKQKKKEELENRKALATSMLSSDDAKERREGRKLLTEVSREERKEKQKEADAARTAADNFKDVVDKLSTLTKALDTQIEEIASYKSKWETRLWTGQSGVYKSITKTMTGAVGVSPLVTLKSLYSNLDSLVDKGINLALEQRAFLQSIKDDIATTFDVTNGTLLQLVRVQQSDTTAARLGMESYLTQLFNNAYQTTEYLSDAFDNVTTALYDTTALLSGESGVGFEYQVQKWLGSMYSMGASSAFVTNLATAIGQLGSGNISGMSESMQTLLAMAASRGGSSLSDMLINGLNESNVNKLLSNIVDYLSELYANGNNNNIVTSQLASLFGVTIADLKAITTLASDSSQIAGLQKSTLGFSQAMGYLNAMIGTMGERMSIGEKMSNMWSNVQYGTASSIANSGVLYGIWKVTNMLDDLMEGMPIPAVSAVGNMVDLESSISTLIKTGVLGTGLMASMVSMVNAGSLGGSKGLISAFGLDKDAITVTRGDLAALAVGGYSSSGVTVVANSSGDDTISGASSSAEEQKLSLQDTSDEKDVNDVFNLLMSIVSEEYTIPVKIKEISSGAQLDVRCTNLSEINWYPGG